MHPPVDIGHDSAFDILQLVKQGIVLTDEAGVILFCNRHIEAMFGYKQERTPGSPFGLFFMDEDVEILCRNVFKMIETDGEFSGEVLFKDVKGGPIFCWLTGSLYQREGGRFFIFSITNITEYKRLEREVLEEGRFARMGKIFDELAHHIRNPVVAIGGLARVLRRPDLDCTRVQRYLETIERETGRLERIVARIMEFGHVVAPHFAWERIGSLMLAWEALALETFAGRPIRFLPLVPSPVAADTGIYTDKRLLVRILIVLLENACEALFRPEDTVAVTVAVEDGQILLAVRDTGMGVPLADQAYVFDPFFTNKPSHIGLGLTIAASIARELGGGLTLASQPGDGATFTFRCPVERRRAFRVRPL
ncbi:MAG: PAS domain-containing sensor histidine kinase [Thermodesulfobacteriota bacterium]